MSLGKDDIEWAINIKLEQIPIELPPLDGMLEFIDYEGVVSKCLGLTNNGKPRKFRGIRTIKEIGSALTTGSNSLPDTSDRNDAVREHYDYILALVKNRNLKHSEQLINRNPRGRKLTLQVYERYLNVKGFKKFSFELESKAAKFGKKLGSFVLKEVQAGRTFNDAFLKTKDLLIKKFEKNMQKLQMD